MERAETVYPSQNYGDDERDERFGGGAFNDVDNGSLAATFNNALDGLVALSGATRPDGDDPFADAHAKEASSSDNDFEREQDDDRTPEPSK